MSQIQLKSHPVTAQRVTKVMMLMQGAQITNPDAGVRLMLDDGTTLCWMSGDGPAPTVGAFVIKDDILHTQYLVTASEFAELFTVTAD